MMEDIRGDQEFIDYIVSAKRTIGDIRPAEFARLYQIARGRAYRVRTHANHETVGNTDYQLMLLGGEITARMIREHSYPEKR
ncbi:MAG: hypothetical protein GVY11_03990 [Gammaproteobacteria bacterium]|jgi:hypothetical protein|nr:hypothetical protein [Gammaproteobacteria bacterium]